MAETEYQELASPLPWIDGNTPDGKTHIWDANGDEVDPYWYSSLIIRAVNTRLAIRTEITQTRRLVKWLRSVIVGDSPQQRDEHTGR